MRRASPTHLILPLLLAGHRVATYITAERLPDESAGLPKYLGTDAPLCRRKTGCRFRARAVC
jgi:hypothetical protein